MRKPTIVQTKGLTIFLAAPYTHKKRGHFSINVRDAHFGTVCLSLSLGYKEARIFQRALNKHFGAEE